MADEDDDESLIVLEGDGFEPPPKRPPLGRPAERPAPGYPKRQEVTIAGATVRRSTLPLWDLKWSPEILRSYFERMGARDFDRLYRQLPIGESDLLFRPSDIDAALDRSQVVPERLSEKDPWFQMVRDAGVDVAIAEDKPERQGSYFAIVGVACTPDGEYCTVLQVERSRGLTFNQQIASIRNAYHLFRYQLITVESNNYQRAIERYFAEDSHEYVPVKPFYTGAAQKRDLEVGLPSLAVEFERRRWKIPYGDAYSRKMMEPLIEELRAYPTPGLTYDTLMALYFAREGRRREIPEAAPDIYILRV